MIFEAAGSALGRLVGYILLTLLTENIIFSRALGASTALWVVRKRYSVFLFGFIMTLIITLSSIAAFFVRPLIKDLDQSKYIIPLAYILIIAVIYVILLLVVQQLPVKRKQMILTFIHRCVFNCSVLGALLLLDSTTKQLDLFDYIGYAIGIGLGFTLANYTLEIGYERLNSQDVPKSFRGFPITLFYLGILSLAIYGMIGHEMLA